MDSKHTQTYRTLLFLAALLASGISLPAQSQSNSSPFDTGFKTVRLRDTLPTNKIACLDMGEKAAIFLMTDSLITAGRRLDANGFFTSIIQFLDSATLRSDTVRITIDRSNWRIENLIAAELEKGIARVYYKKRHTFVDYISHRLELYGEHGDRFFYLPDQRPFFFIMEYSGIIRHQSDLSNPGNNYEAYLQEGKKLASLRKE
jgi:hypothetical protein